MDKPLAIIVSARRSALGRVGGLHRFRRVEELSRLVIAAALADCGADATRVEGLILGNTTAGGNVARTVALAAGLPEAAFASTIDSQCASGLEAILDAGRRIAAGEADLLIAGGAESLSTAPWRIARSKNPYQLPSFVGIHPHGAETGEDSTAFAADETLATQDAIARAAQDALVVQSYLAAALARDQRLFLSEIVAQRTVPEELRDQFISEPSADALSDLDPFGGDRGSVTPGNTSPLSDGAAFAVVVSERMWTALGRPKGMLLTRSAAVGVTGPSFAESGRIALETLFQRATDKVSRSPASLQAIEISEISAAEAISFARKMKLADGVFNAAGGALVRGLPLGAASAVALTRLFTRLVKGEAVAGSRGAVAQRAAGGLGVAAVFEAIT